MRTIVVALTVGLVASAPLAVAQSGSPVVEFGMPMVPPSVEPLVNLLNRALKKTHIVADSDAQAVAGGFVAIHAPISISCPGSGTCTIEAHPNVQVSGGAGSGRWAICTKVDGFYLANPICPFIDRIPATGDYQARSFVMTGSGFASGAHSVVTEVYTDGAATRGIYEISYRVYKP